MNRPMNQSLPKRCRATCLGILASTLLIHSPTFASVAIANVKAQYGSYVILGQQSDGANVAIARTVIDSNFLCPTVSLVGQTSSIPLTMTTRDNPNHFPVLVCETVVGFDQQYQLNFADKRVPLAMAKSKIERIAVFGDTGCKTAEVKKGKKQGCQPGSPAQPFKSLADSAAKTPPDVVLHMGDYNYRGTSGDIYFNQIESGQLVQKLQWPYDAGDGLTQPDHCGTKAPFYSQSAVNSNRPDIWANWHDDLFKPAKKLMAAAPWIVARGNHELCSRAGPGYFYFLDPNSNLLKGQQQISCPMPQLHQDALSNSVVIPSYKVSFDKLDVAVIDSTNACDSYNDSPFAAVYEQVFKGLSTLVSNKNTWLVTHRPIWGVQSYDATTSVACAAGDTQYSCVNQMMQQAIATQPSKNLPEAVKLVVTGHMHTFESVSFINSKRAPNIIVGSSGVELAGKTTNTNDPIMVDGESAHILTTNTQVKKKGKTSDAFGFLDVTFDNVSGWTGNLVNPGKKLTIAKCSSALNLAQGVCELAPGITVVPSS
jgi:hypothetical protein